MVIPRPGKKHINLFYYQSTTRIWRRLLPFNLVLWIVWWFAPDLPSFQPPKDEIILYAAIISTTIMILFFLMSNKSYVRANRGHVIIGVPFYRVKIPYSYIKSLRITDLKHALNGVKLKKGDIKFILRYAADTPVSALILKELPKPEGIMHIFFPRYMFLAANRGFFFLLEDLMGFNTEFESRLNSARTIEDVTN